MGHRLTTTGQSIPQLSSSLPVPEKKLILKGIPILLYHKVSPDPRAGDLTYRVLPEDFNWQMRYLKQKGYHTVNIGDVIDHYHNGKNLPENPVVITFDDGYYDNYKYAFRILKKYAFSATIFIVSNTVGGLNEFDLKDSIQPQSEMLNWDEIREMDSNRITIGAHTLDHLHLTKINPEEARRQIIGSKRILEKALRKEVLYFSYPYGEYNSTIVDIVRKSRYRAAVSTLPGIVGSSDNPYFLRRISIWGGYDQVKFVKELHKYRVF